jgi:uncharacterized protein
MLMKPRILWAALKKEIDTDEIIVITGPRQVGKTTTIHWLLNEISSTNKIYFDFQNIADRELFETKNFDSIIGELQKRGLITSQKLYIAIDEIQLLESLPGVVKYLYDHYNIKFFLTGSSSFYIKNKFTESMAGRKLVYEMFPLRFQEFLDFRDITYKLPNKLDLENDFNENAYNLLASLYREYIEYGGLPKVVLTENVNRKKQLLEEIFSSYITIDVEALADFKSSSYLRKVIKLLASRIGSRLNVNEISKITGLSRPTIDSYIEFLEQSYLIRNLRVFSNSTDVQTRNLSKSYFVDTGIANLNADLSGGAKYENTVCHQLSFYGDLNYYTTRDGEIDFILNKEVAFEVKETPTDTDLGRLTGRGEALNIEKRRLIGKEKSARFNDFLWGGLIR